MSDTNENKKKIPYLNIFNVLVPILCVFLTHLLTNTSAQDSIVESLSTHFDYVDENMSYEKALKAVYEESEKQEKEIEELKNQVVNLEKTVESTPNFEFKNPRLISDGLKVQDSINKSVIVIENSNYYSEGILNLVLHDKFSYDFEENTVFYNTGEEKIFSEAKIDLFDTEVLYEGVCYGKILPSDGKDFSMGSKTYNKGFIICDDHSLFGEGDGYALFDLQGKYSKMTFDVGRTNEYEKQDVVLKVYLNDEYVEEYPLNAQSPPVSLEIGLNYANDMKLEISGGSRVKYGFANAILYY